LGGVQHGTVLGRSCNWHNDASVTNSRKNCKRESRKFSWFPRRNLEIADDRLDLWGKFTLSRNRATGTNPKILACARGDYRYTYHMSSTYQMTRTSMALDGWTIGALKHLSEKWKISKAEVIRRAVRQLSELAEQEDRAPTPLEALDWLQNGGGLMADEAAKFRAEIAANREARTYWWQA
jgi:hypothetical protein